MLVNNASVLGPSPQPPLADYPLDELERVYRVNVLAPLALVQLALPRFVDGARILNVTSDAAVEPYEGWGGYGSSKAALEQLTTILAVEHPALYVYAVDPATCGPGCIRRRFPARTSLIARSPRKACPGCCADRGRPPERPLPGTRTRGDEAVSAVAFKLPPRERRTSRRRARRRRAAGRASTRRTDRARPLHGPAELLSPGDLLVVNVSATIPAAVAAHKADGSPVRFHCSSRAPGSVRNGG